MQTAFEQKHRRGFIRSDGWVFVEYRKDFPDGEYWLPPEKFADWTSRRRNNYIKNRDKTLSFKKEYYLKNRDRILQREADSRRGKPELYRLRDSKKRVTSAHKIRARNRERQARLRGLGAKLSPEERQITYTIYDCALRVSSCTGIKHHVDHIFPLAHGGKHAPNNLQILPAKINLRKNSKLGFSIPTHD